MHDISIDQVQVRDIADKRQKEEITSVCLNFSFICVCLCPCVYPISKNEQTLDIIATGKYTTINI